jgi:hypothetical protein
MGELEVWKYGGMEVRIREAASGDSSVDKHL